MSKTNTTLTSKALKDALWSALQGVRSKTVTPAEATSTASLAREIVRVVKAEIQVASATKSRAAKQIGFDG